MLDAYPTELRTMLRKEYNKAGMRTALEKIHKAFPEFKDRLTSSRAFSVVRVRNRREERIKKAMLNSPKVPWVALPNSQRKAIVKVALKMREDNLRWSTISKKLTEKYPDVEMLKALKLRRAVMPTANKLNGLAFGVKASKSRFTLQISNSSSFEFKTEIPPGAVIKILGLTMGVVP